MARASKTKRVRRCARRWPGPGPDAVTPRSCAVSGKGSGPDLDRRSALLRPGQRGHLFYRTLVHHNGRRKDERRSFSETDYIRLLDAAHQRLKAPIVLVWDNLNTHISRRDARLHRRPDWLTVIRLPAYAPDLNPAEGVWANMKNGLANLGTTNLDDLHRIISNRLKRIQYRPDLIDGFLAQTGLTLDDAD